MNSGRTIPSFFLLSPWVLPPPPPLPSLERKKKRTLSPLSIVLLSHSSSRLNHCCLFVFVFLLLLLPDSAPSLDITSARYIREVWICQRAARRHPHVPDANLKRERRVCFCFFCFFLRARRVCKHWRLLKISSGFYEELSHFQFANVVQWAVSVCWWAQERFFHPWIASF